MPLTIGLRAFKYAEPVANIPKAVVPMPLVPEPSLEGFPVNKPVFAPIMNAQGLNPEPKLEPLVQELP